MNNTLDRRSKFLISLSFGLAIVALAGWYLLAWRNLPLYSDEVALRVQAARALVDGFVAYPPIPQCSSNPTSIPWPLIPASLVMSFWDMTFGWSFIRLVPCLIILLAIATLATHIQRCGPHLAVGLLPIAFLGAAGCGLAMMRMECFQILQVLACLLAYMTLKSRWTGRFGFPAQVFLLIASLLSIFVHPQGLMLIPAAVFISVAIGLKPDHPVNRLTSIAVVTLLVIGTYGVAGKIAFPCNGAPAITLAMQGKTILGQDQAAPFLHGVAPWINKLDAYARNFTYNAAYPVNHLPGLSDVDLGRRSVRGANFLVYWIAIANILLAICATVIAGVSAASSLLSTKMGLKSRLSAFVGNGYTYIFLVGLPHILYLIYDVEGAFYRPYYFNFIFAILNAVAISRIRGRQQLILLPPVTVAVCLLLVSTYFNNRFFESNFTRGWVTSLPITTDWIATSDAVNRLAGSCGVSENARDLFVDDLTYSALRHHRHLMPITYVMLGDYLAGSPTDSQSFISRLASLGAAAIVQCADFGSGIPANAMRSGGLCCVKFQK